MRASPSKARITPGLPSDDVEGGKKPVVNTFFHILHGDTLAESNAAIIAVWKQAWSNAGFHPRVLSLTDAEKHADYSDIVSQAEGIPGIGNNKYEQMCYLRYFAMSASGGGFMADYDTVPLNIVAADYTDGRLPNDGNFTNFSRNPALLSGSDKEWDRVARALVQEGEKKIGNYDMTKNPPFSDMLALFGLTDNKEVMWDGSRLPKCGIMEFPTIKEPDAVDCDCAGPALHVSHHDSKSTGVPIHLRGLAMGEFMNNYHLACGGPAFFKSPNNSSKIS